MLAGRPTNDAPPETIQDLVGAQLLARLDGVDLLSRKLLSGKLPGERRSKSRGQSVEFDDYRPYAPGDDLRHIDWNVFARLDKFFIKLFLEDQDLGLHLIVDASPSMDAGGSGEPTKLLYAHRLAMALAYMALVHNNRVAVTVLGQDTGPDGGSRDVLARLNPLRGRLSVPRVGDFLLKSARGSLHGAGVPLTPVPSPGDSGRLGAALEAATRPGAAKGSSMVLVLGDLLEPAWLLEDGPTRPLNALARGGRIDAIVLQTLSKAELDPAAEASLRGDVRLIDAESGLGKEVTVSPAVLEEAGSRARAYVDRIGSACAARGIDHAVVTTETDPAEVLLGRLRERGVLG